VPAIQPKESIMNTKLAFAALAALSLGLTACDSDSDSATGPSSPAPAAPSRTILQIAAADTTFETLAAAVTAAGLASTLADTTKQFTVFAPTDAAFAKLPAGTVTELLKDPTGDLKSILLYHVVGAKVESPTVVTLSKATTVNGKDVTIEVKGGKVYLNGTTMVTVVDIQAKNGVIHVIDAVLLPPAK
jgi:transforming growth factor-beta-induced protein